MTLEEKVSHYKQENKGLKLKIKALLTSVSTFKKTIEAENSELRAQMEKMAQELAAYKTGAVRVYISHF
jgi:hypothetical protein